MIVRVAFASICLFVLQAGASVGFARPSPPYSPHMTGSVQGYRLWGIEPDGDPLYQVVLQTRLAPSRDIPAINLIVEAFLENFKPDTTPILPDLLSPNQTAQNLGGFLQGKAILTDDAGNALYIGSFLDEAFLDNGRNHLAIQLFGSGNTNHARGTLKGSFTLRQDATLAGSLRGQLDLPVAARAQILARAGAKLKPLTQIISQVTVKPAPMVGKPAPGSTSTPLNTGYGPSPSTGTSRSISPWSVAAGVGAILSFFLAVCLYLLDRRKKRLVRSS
jgi:hypothetical protein